MFQSLDQELARARHLERMQLLHHEHSNRPGRDLTDQSWSARRSRSRRGR